MTRIVQLASLFDAESRCSTQIGRKIRWNSWSSRGYSMDQIDLLRHAIGMLVRLGIPYLVVGSYASSAWGETRDTSDIDIVVELRHDQIKPLCLSFSGPSST